MLWIPVGFAHGFRVLSDKAQVLYKATDFYAPEYERTILWSDPDLKINWEQTLSRSYLQKTSGAWLSATLRASTRFHESHNLWILRPSR